MPQERSWQAIGQDDLAEQWKVHGRLFFRVAYNILRDAAWAEDACQQAFLKAWQRRDDIEKPATLRAWLAQTVVNEAFQIMRHQKTEGQALWRKARQTAGTGEIAGQSLERREFVTVAVARLPEPMRTVVALRVLDGLPGEQVKEILGCSSAEVSRRLHEGMERLRREVVRQHVTAGEL